MITRLEKLKAAWDADEAAWDAHVADWYAYYDELKKIQ